MYFEMEQGFKEIKGDIMKLEDISSKVEKQGVEIRVIKSSR